MIADSLNLVYDCGNHADQESRNDRRRTAPAYGQEENDVTCSVRFTCAEMLLRLLGIGLSNGSVIALNAIGVTLVYGVVRMINFAHGDLFALCTALVATTITHMILANGSLLLPVALLLPLTFVIAAGGGALTNVAIEAAAFRPFRNRTRVAPLIATIGLSFVLYQGALLLRYVTNRYIPGEHRSVPGIPEVPRVRIPDMWPDIDLIQVLGLPLRVPYRFKDAAVLLVAALLALLVDWMLARTRIGRALRACAQDPDMATLCGVDRDRTIRLVFALGGALAGAAAWMYTLYYDHPYTLYGAQSGLVAFTAAVMGGIGRPRGAFVSGLLLGVVASFSDYFLSTAWTPVLLLGMLIVLLLFRPSGLGADSSAEETTTSLLEAVGGAGRRALAGRERWLLGGLGVLALVYPLLDRAFGWRQEVVVTGMLIFALLALGLNLLLGFAGLLDLGYAACFAIGAYTAGLLTVPGGISSRLPWLTQAPLVFGAAAIMAALFGLLNGALTRRLRGEYLAITTLAFGQIVPLTVLNLDVTGGIGGLAGLPSPRLGPVMFSSTLQHYYVALVFVVLAAFWCLRLAPSRLGRAWAAISTDEGAAASSGVDVVRTRTMAFMLSSATAGVAGALFGALFSYVDPSQSELRISVTVLAMVVIGGAGSVPGAIVGALLVAGYDQLLIPLLGAWVQNQATANDMPILALFDVRSLNYLSFGMALYLTVLWRARAGSERRTGQETGRNASPARSHASNPDQRQNDIR